MFKKRLLFIAILMFVFSNLEAQQLSEQLGCITTNFSFFISDDEVSPSEQCIESKMENF